MLLCSTYHEGIAYDEQNAEMDIDEGLLSDYLSKAEDKIISEEIIGYCPLCRAIKVIDKLEQKIDFLSEDLEYAEKELAKKGVVLNWKLVERKRKENN